MSRKTKLIIKTISSLVSNILLIIVTLIFSIDRIFRGFEHIEKLGDAGYIHAICDVAILLIMITLAIVLLIVDIVIWIMILVQFKKNNNIINKIRSHIIIELIQSLFMILLIILTNPLILILFIIFIIGITILNTIIWIKL